MQHHFDYTHELLKKQHAMLKKQQAELAKAISTNIELTLEVYPYTTGYEEKTKVKIVRPGKREEDDVMPWDA